MISIKILPTKILSLFILFTCINCNAKHSENQQTLSQIESKTEKSKQIPLKIKTTENQFVTQINLETDIINFRVYYLKNNELAYLKLNQSNDYKPIDFCINLSSMEEALNNIKLFKKDSFYYLMIPTCSEELPMFHVLKFDNLSNYEDLGIYSFKYDERIFKLGNFNSIKYTLVDNHNEIGIKGIISGQQFDLSEITKFDSKNQISSQNLNHINQLTLKDKSKKKSDQESNKENNKINTLFKKFEFEYIISEIEKEDDTKYSIKISLTNKETNKIQKIDFAPEALYSKKRISNPSSHSYFAPNQDLIRTSEGIEKYHGLIVLDFNFDRLEDFAIINYEGSNGGPQYAYYKQKSDGQFELDIQLTNNIRLFPVEINNKEKILKFEHPSGCCQINTFKIQIQPNGRWKEIYSKLKDIK